MVDDENDYDDVEANESNFEKLRSAANSAGKLGRKLSAAEQEITQLRTEVAFSKAGLHDLSDRQRVALLAAHADGELSRDALRETAAELRFIEPDEADGESTRREDALQGAQKIGDANKGARPPAATPALADRIRNAEANDPALAMRLKAIQVLSSGKAQQLH